MTEQAPNGRGLAAFSSRALSGASDGSALGRAFALSGWRKRTFMKTALASFITAFRTKAADLLVRTMAVIFLVSAGPAYAEDVWHVESVVIDGSTIKLALPAQYARAASGDPKYDFGRKAFAEEDIQLIAGFFTEDDYRYALVVQMPESKGYEYGRASWARDVAEAKKQLDLLNPKGLADSLNEVFNRLLKLGKSGGDVSLALEKPHYFPVSDESSKHYTFLMLSAVNSSIKGVASRSVFVGSGTFIFVGGRLIVFYVYEPFVDKNTYFKVSALTKDIVTRTFAANPN